MARFHLVVSRAVVTLLCLFAFNAAALAQFEFRDSIIAQQQPYSMAVGDFNRDGKLDLAVAAAGTYSDDIVILLGRGDGTFRTPVYYTAGIGAISIVAADFNRDGNLDLAVASQSNYISILMGNGDGTFQPATKSPPVIAFESFVTVGDLNGDGKIDLIAFGGSTATISVLLGNGNGTFQKALVTRPPFALQTIGVGDFNRDGKLDVATAGVFGGTSPVNILLGNGDGTFRQGASYAGETSPVAIAVGDFNGDRNPDMAIANFQGTGISVWLGNGDGTFQPPVDYATSFPEWITAADVNGDGKADLVAANFGGSAGPAGATVFRGKGDGTFFPGSFYPAGGETRFVAVGDFNGDRKPDLVVPDYLSHDVVVLLNTGAASFLPTTPLTFAVQLIGTISSPQTVTLTNTGKTTVAITSISALAPFQVNNTCGTRLAVGATCDLVISFGPSVQGPATGLITIVDSASSKPQFIEVSGSGTVVQLAPETLVFGIQKVGTSSKPLPVIVTNQGSAAVMISGIGTDSTNFTETNNCATQLNPGASCTVSVTFRPARPGPLTGTLSVADNGGGGSQTVALSGTGD